MGLKDGEYKEFKFLQQRIIKKPLLEINNKSDLLVRVEFKKQKRRITALRFFIKPQKKKQVLLLDPTAAKVKHMELYQRLKEYFHLTSIQAQEALVTHKKEDILENLRYVEKKIKEGNVNCIGAYTITAIKENYRILPNLFSIDKTENERAERDAENAKRFRKRFFRLKRTFCSEALNC